MDAIEPVLVQVIIAAAKQKVPMNRDKIMVFAEAIIKGSSHALKVTKFKKQNVVWYTKRKSELGIDLVDPELGIGWYYRFRNRWHDELKSVRITNMDERRLSWSTYENLLDMYEHIYAGLEEAGHIEKLAQAEWQNAKGEKADQAHASGL